ncbi:hypothetical protein M422DRAFT_265134 [Sphaerobolus stellatus SS14]|uniref:Uncharacterized protein n=1 Tax=Sphaerobolus stellatus (strain SS14) TaxID=990650 RepID=A0A0C9TRZ4_SPHS4|nr:hypothetical protein M422DRAFT_265134 [Sphaerobolus stellatus SS14]
MSSRIHKDILCSDTTRYKKKAILLSVVQRTWGDLLKTENIRGLRPEDITGFLSPTHHWKCITAFSRFENYDHPMTTLSLSLCPLYATYISPPYLSSS